MSAALPPADLLAEQARWLAPARSRLLRRVAVARRRRTLDLGAGHGAITGELVRRSGGPVVALDLAADALREAAATPFGAALPVGGDARRLPFADDAFDLVVSQVTLLWVQPLAAALDEIARVLGPGGALVALEPEYGGMIEHPPEVATRELWTSALTRAGADPHVARKLPGLLAKRGFDVHVGLFNTLVPPAPERFALLRGLPLTPQETARLDRAERAAEARSGSWQVVAHLPFFLVTARR
jgi:SAM-dependent methyltransferase